MTPPKPHQIECLNVHCNTNLLYLCVCACALQHVCGQLAGVSSLHLVHLRDRTQVVTFDKCPYLTLSHFTDLNFLLLRQPHCVWMAWTSQSSYLSLTRDLQFYCNCLFILCLYVGIMRVYAWFIWGSQRTTHWSKIFPPALWIPRGQIQIIRLDLVAHTFTSWAILLA